MDQINTQEPGFSVSENPVVKKTTRMRRSQPAKRRAGKVSRRERRISRRGAFMCIVLAAVMVTSALYFLDPSRRGAMAATFDWIQSNWSGGADTGAVATYTSDRTTWTKYFAKSSNVVAGDSSITLDAASGSVAQTSDADFGAGTGEEAYGANLYVLNGSLQLKKQNGRPCTAATECARGFCTAGVCADPYKYGVCAGIGVYPTDSAAAAWKTTNDTCNAPQCTGTLNAGILSSDNNVDFSLYPARNVCKNVHGRLPTISEIGCIRNNQASLGVNFSSAWYWTSEEASASGARYWSFSNNSAGTTSKTNTGDTHIRCVREEP